MTWRKAWARSWEQVKYCSDACRQQKASVKDDGLERAILELLAARSATATICPSEVARAQAPEDWRSLMEPVRQAARRLVARGVLEITQQGAVVDPSEARGAIRLRLRAAGPT